MSACRPGPVDELIGSAVAALDQHPDSAGVAVSAEDFSRAAEACRLVTARNSRTFYLASALLPPEKRCAIRCLYAFCRTTDDIVDLPDHDPRQELRQWEERALKRDPEHTDDVLLAWHVVRSRYGIPDLFARHLIRAVSEDISRSRYGTFDELARYCYGVASTVGLMSMCVIGYAGAQAVPYAVNLGLALQLTNILRDVGEDWRSGRLYLPTEDLERFGVTEEQIAQGVVDGRWRDLMRFEIARNRALYAEAWPGIAQLHPDGRFAIAAAARLYGAILEDIERRDYQVFTRRAHVSSAAKLARLPGIWLALRGLQSGTPPDSPAPEPGDW
jgi:phytoene synthase